MKKNILITGVNGFIGKALTQKLISNHYKVIGLFNTQKSNQVFAKEQWIELSIDLANSSEVGKILKLYEPEGFIHLAGRHAFSPTTEIYKDNILMTSSVLEALQAHSRPIKTVLMSSSAAYGKSLEKYDNISESAPFIPLTAYGVSKAAVDLMGHQIFQTKNFPVSIARPFNVIGPDQSALFFCSKLASQIASAEKKKSPPIIKLGNLDTQRDFIDVRDTAEGILKIFEKGLPGESYNLCSGNSTPIKNVLEKMLGFSEIEFKIEIQNHDKNTDVTKQQGSYEKALQQLGWSPKVSLESTLKDILENWRQKI